MSVSAFFRKIKNGVLTRINDAKNVEFYLKEIRGIIHVGANEGQERDLYAKHQLAVLWVEPIPEVYERLKKNIEGLAGQTCLNNLVSDIDDKEYAFHVSNNDGLSSSIFELAEVRAIWPQIEYSREIQLRSVTLKTLIQRHQVKLELYDALVLDTQGSELLILKGGEDLLSRFKFIQAEVADFESYRGACKLAEFDNYLKSRGFRRVVKKHHFLRSDSRIYYEVIYART